jgi:hypothetical protein
MRLLWIIVDEQCASNGQHHKYTALRDRNYDAHHGCPIPLIHSKNFGLLQRMCSCPCCDGLVDEIDRQNFCQAGVLFEGYPSFLRLFTGCNINVLRITSHNFLQYR